MVLVLRRSHALWWSCSPLRPVGTLGSGGHVTPLADKPALWQEDWQLLRSQSPPQPWALCDDHEPRRTCDGHEQKLKFWFLGCWDFGVDCFQRITWPLLIDTKIAQDIRISSEFTGFPPATALCLLAGIPQSLARRRELPPAVPVQDLEREMSFSLRRSLNPSRKLVQKNSSQKMLQNRLQSQDLQLWFQKPTRWK